MWEDPQNVDGGRWLMVVDKQVFTLMVMGISNCQRRVQILDHYWMELLTAIIGEQFEDLGEFICGAVVNIRQKGDKVTK